LILTLLAALGIGTSALNRSNAPPASSGQSISNPLHRQGAGLYAHSAAPLLGNFFDTNAEQVKGDKPWLRNNAPSVTEKTHFRKATGGSNLRFHF
jgi:hypothetical protein